MRIEYNMAPSRVACEMQLRCICRLITDQIGSAVSPQIIRLDLVINYQFKPLCRVSSVARGVVDVYWDTKYAAELTIDTEAIKLGLASVQASKQTNWTQQL